MLAEKSDLSPRFDLGQTSHDSAAALRTSRHTADALLAVTARLCHRFQAAKAAREATAKTARDAARASVKFVGCLTPTVRDVNEVLQSLLSATAELVPPALASASAAASTSHAGVDASTRDCASASALLRALELQKGSDKIMARALSDELARSDLSWLQLQAHLPERALDVASADADADAGPDVGLDAPNHKEGVIKKHIEVPASLFVQQALESKSKSKSESESAGADVP